MARSRDYLNNGGYENVDTSTSNNGAYSTQQTTHQMSSTPAVRTQNTAQTSASKSDKYSFNGNVYSSYEAAQQAQKAHQQKVQATQAMNEADLASVNYDFNMYNTLKNNGQLLSQISNDEWKYISKLQKTDTSPTAYTKSVRDQYLYSLGLPSSKDISKYRGKYREYMSSGSIEQVYAGLTTDELDYIKQKFADSTQVGLDGRLHTTDGKELKYEDNLLDTQLRENGLPSAKDMEIYHAQYIKERNEQRQKEEERKKKEDHINDFYEAVYQQQDKGADARTAWYNVLNTDEFSDLYDIVKSPGRIETTPEEEPIASNDGLPFTEIAGQPEQATPPSSYSFQEEDKTTASNLKQVKATDDYYSSEFRVSPEDYEKYAIRRTREIRQQKENERRVEIAKNFQDALTKPATTDSEKNAQRQAIATFFNSNDIRDAEGNHVDVNEYNSYLTLLNSGVPTEVLQNVSTDGVVSIEKWNDTANKDKPAQWAKVRAALDGVSESDGDYTANTQAYIRTKRVSSRSDFENTSAYDPTIYEKQTSVSSTMSTSRNNTTVVSVEGALYAAVNGQSYNALDQSASAEDQDLLRDFTETNGDVAFIDYMTDEEKGVFNTLFRRNPREAKEYLRTIEPLIEKRQTNSLVFADSQERQEHVAYAMNLRAVDRSLDEISEGETTYWQKEAWDKYRDFSDESLLRIIEQSSQDVADNKDVSQYAVTGYDQEEGELLTAEEAIARKEGATPVKEGSPQETLRAAQFVYNQRQKAKEDAAVTALMYGYTASEGEAATEQVKDNIYGYRETTRLVNGVVSQEGYREGMTGGEAISALVQHGWKEGASRTLMNEMTEDQINRYNWLAVNKGEEAAIAYYNSIKDGLDALASAKISAGYHAVSGDNLLTNAAAFLGSVLAMPFTGMMSVGGSALNMMTGTELTRAQATTWDLTGGIREGISSNIVNAIPNDNLAAVADFLFNVTASSADSGLGAIMSSSVPIMGELCLSMSAYSSSLRQGLDRGLSTEDATALATTSAIVEFITEHLGIDGVVKGLESVAEKSAEKGTSQLLLLLQQAGIQFIPEALEEGVGNIMNTAFDVLINGDKSQLLETYNNAIRNGSTKEEATKLAALDFAKETALEMLAGGLAGAGSVVTAGSFQFASNGKQEFLNALQRRAMPEIVPSNGRHAYQFAHGGSSVITELYGADATTNVQNWLDTMETADAAKSIDSIAKSLRGIDSSSGIYDILFDESGNSRLSREQQVAFATALHMDGAQANADSIEATYVRQQALRQSASQREANTSLKNIKTNQEVRSAQQQLRLNEETIKNTQQENENTRSRLKSDVEQARAKADWARNLSAVRGTDEAYRAEFAAREELKNSLDALEKWEKGQNVADQSTIKQARQQIRSIREGIDKHYASLNSFLSSATSDRSFFEAENANSKRKIAELGQLIDNMMSADFSDAINDTWLESLQNQLADEQDYQQRIARRMSKSSPTSLSDAFNAQRRGNVLEYASAVEPENSAVKQGGQTQANSQSNEQANTPATPENTEATNAEQATPEQQTKKPEKKTFKISKAAQQRFTKVAKRFGCEVVWQTRDEIGGNGKYDPETPNRIYLATDMIANKGLPTDMVVAREFFTHEIVHYVANTKMYQRLSLLAERWYKYDAKERGYNPNDYYEAIIQQRIDWERENRNREFTREQAREELTAIFAQDVLFRSENKNSLTWLTRTDGIVTSNFLQTVEYLIKRGNVRKMKDGSAVKTLLIDAERTLALALSERQKLDAAGLSSAFSNGRKSTQKTNTRTATQEQTNTRQNEEQQTAPVEQTEQAVPSQETEEETTPEETVAETQTKETEQAQAKSEEAPSESESVEETPAEESPVEENVEEAPAEETPVEENTAETEVSEPSPVEETVQETEQEETPAPTEEVAETPAPVEETEVAPQEESVAEPAEETAEEAQPVSEETAPVTEEAQPVQETPVQERAKTAEEIAEEKARQREEWNKPAPRLNANNTLSAITATINGYQTTHLAGTGLGESAVSRVGELSGVVQRSKEFREGILLTQFGNTPLYAGAPTDGGRYVFSRGVESVGEGAVDGRGSGRTINQSQKNLTKKSSLSTGRSFIDNVINFPYLSNTEAKEALKTREWGSDYISDSATASVYNHESNTLGSDIQFTDDSNARIQEAADYLLRKGRYDGHIALRIPAGEGFHATSLQALREIFGDIPPKQRTKFSFITAVTDKMGGGLNLNDFNIAITTQGETIPGFKNIDITPVSAEQNANVSGMDATMSGNNVETTNADEAIEKSGVLVNSNGEAVMNVINNGNAAMFSTGTYEIDGRAALEKYLAKRAEDGFIDDSQAKYIQSEMDRIYDVCKNFEGKFVSFGNWSRAAVEITEEGNPVFSVIRSNSEYPMNIDFSLVCVKRRALDAVFNKVIEQGLMEDIILDDQAIVLINEAIREEGFETACTMCFVEAKRFQQAKAADRFVNKYNDLVKSLGGDADYFNFGGNNEVRQAEGIRGKDNSELNFSKIDKIIEKYEAKKRAKPNAGMTVEEAIAFELRDNPDSRRLVQRGDFMSSRGFDSVAKNAPEVLKLYNKQKGTGGPKASFGDMQYLNDIEDKNWSPEKAYSVGGVRVQSFSDFVPYLAFDYVQMMADLSAGNLPAHAYTKEKSFAKLFGLTGMKINLSLVPMVGDAGAGLNYVRDFNGNIVLDEYGQPATDYAWAKESFDYGEALRIQSDPEYGKNCGTIAIGVSDAHIKQMLNDPSIRMIIPYHKSSLNPVVAKMEKIAEFKDYTKVQRTKGTNGKALKTDFNFNEALRKLGDPRAAADEYLDWCDSHGYTPKFADFRGEPNYYKLLEDFTLFDEQGNYVPQGAVKMNFPTDSNQFGSFSDILEKSLGSYEQYRMLPDAKAEALAQKVIEISNKRKADLGMYSDGADVEDIASSYTPQESLADLRRIFNGSPDTAVDAEYMRLAEAYKNGDKAAEQELGKMVKEAAESAGYTIKAYHGTTEQFNEFSRKGQGKNHDGYLEFGAGFYFTPNEQEAREWITRGRSGQTSRGRNVMEVYLNPSRILEADSRVEGGSNYLRGLGLADGEAEFVANRAYRFINYLIEDRGFSNMEAQETLKALGYDAIDATYSMGKSGQYVVFDPNQIKSADPVTYDDNGNIIPLSERFNSDANDIRYSSGETLEDLISQYKLKKQSKVGKEKNIRTPEYVAENVRVSDVAQTLKEAASEQARERIDDILVEALDETQTSPIIPITQNTGLLYKPMTMDEMLQQGVDYIVEAGSVDEAMRRLAREIPIAKLTDLTKLEAAAMAVFSEIANTTNFDPNAYGDFVAAIGIMNGQWGRMGKAMQLLNQSPIGRRKYMEKVVEHINAENAKAMSKGLDKALHRNGVKPIEIDENLYKDLEMARTPEEVRAAEFRISEEIGRQSPLTVESALRNWRYFAMLANPVTHWRNITGNISMLGMRAAKDAVAAGLESAAVRMNLMDESDRTHYFSLKKNPEVRDFALQMYLDNAEAVQGNDRFGVKDKMRDAVKKSPVKWIDSLMRFNGNKLEQEDAMFLRATYVAAASQFIRARGLDVENMTAREKAEVNQYATQQAQEATYRDASELADLLNMVSRKGKGWQFVVESVMPFKKTPINIAKRGIEYSPIGLFKGVLDLVRSSNGKTISASKICDELGKGVVGSALTAIGYWLAKAGILKLSPADDEDKKTESFGKDTGRQAYSLEFGNVSLKIESIVPMTFPLFAGASLYETFADGGFDVSKGFQALSDAVMGITDPLMDMSFMSSLNSTLSSYSKNKVLGVAENMVTSYMGQYLPTVIGKFNNVLTPTRRTTKSSKAGFLPSTLDRAWRSYATKVPGGTALLEPYVKATGETDTKDSFGDYLLSFVNNFVSPANVSVIDTDPAIREISRIVRETGETDFVPRSPSNSFRYGGESYALTAPEYTEYSKDHNETVFSALTAMMMSPEYARATDEQRATLLKRTYTKAHEAMMEKWKAIIVAKRTAE